MSTVKTRLFFLRKRISLLKHLKRKIRQDRQAAALHGEGSKAIYDIYGEREIHDFNTGNCRVLVNGEISRLSQAKVRNAYIAPVIREIQRLLVSRNKPLRILEVGCGNATNLMLLNSQFANQVELSGIDISGKRIEVGRNYWSTKLNNVKLYQTSATDMAIFSENYFDIAYSICALEQITYRIHEVLSEMKRVSKDCIVCVEPVYEYGNATQKLYNIVNDQCRTLLQDMQSCELRVEEHGLLPILHNPLNPVGLIIGRKADVSSAA